jgi:hypothetical protein
MKLLRLLACVFVVGAAAWNCLTARLESSQGGGMNFDKLSDEDRKAMQERFGKEIWPLMQRAGKDGCIGCHSAGKGGQALRLTGDVAKDFPRMVKDGFFIPDDSGSLLGRIMDKDAKRRMPPDKRQAWDEKEIQLLRAFVADLEKKQRK